MFEIARQYCRGNWLQVYYTQYKCRYTHLPAFHYIVPMAYYRTTYSPTHIIQKLLRLPITIAHFTDV